MNGWRLLGLLATLAFALAGCSAPVSAVRVDRVDAYRDLTRSVVTTGQPSLSTRDVLLERGFLEAFDEDPEATLADLHQLMVATAGDRDVLFALAELSFLYGQKAERPEYQMAAAVYAFAFLFPEDVAQRPGPFDPRFRSAADLYNWSLTAALASDDGSNVVLQSGTFELPFGRLDVVFDPATLRVGDLELYGFVPVSEYEVHGLAMRYRRPGIGAPLAASTRSVPGAEPGRDMIGPRIRVPVTALLRIPDAQRALLDGTSLTATLELHPNWDVGSVTIADELVPLEQDPTAALALTFTGVPINRIELLGFLGRLSGLLAERPPLVSASLYRPGLIPVVFVHGTASSSVRWAEMYNRLQADPEIRSRYQFWFFQYESDKPIALSALHLREALTAAVAKLDPDGEDPALRRMVLIGHSQGGLLVKMQAIDSGDRIWNSVSRKPLGELRLSDETRDLLQRGLFVEPMPEVSRVVFISTPHRGSFVAGRRLIANLARWLTTLPLSIAGVAADVARNRDAIRRPFVATAVDNMSPGSTFIRGLQEVPVAATIPAHSIISVKGSGPAEEGDDGVVEYSSAHIDEAVSELVVRSPHSCQGNPHTMEEVRRILRLHVGLTADGALPAEPRVSAPRP